MRNWLADAGTGLAAQLGGAIAPFPDTPQFAPYKATPQVAVAPPAPPPVPVPVPTPGRPPLIGAMAGFGAGARQPFGAVPGIGGDARQPFDVLGPQPLGTGFDLPKAPWSGGGDWGGATNIGGEWATLDQYNNAFNQAQQATGTPANLIKSLLAREGSFGRDKVVTPLRGDEVYAFNGIYRTTAESRGIDFDRMLQDDNYAVYAVGKILADIKAENGFQSWDDTAAYYFAGPNWNNPGWTDERGNTVESYKYHPEGGVITRFNQLNQMGGQDGIPTYRVADTGLGNNAVIQEALQFVGTPYVWGGIPGAGDDPRQTGWDCSGMTYWLDQKYGDGSLPQGSHFQYQYAQQTGRLFTDLSQLQPGDLVFIDTGWQGGAGAELNRAGHVGVYIGNGQMLHAANQQQGTIVSPLSGYQNILGAMHQSFSGGGGFGGNGPVSNNPYRVRQSVWR